MGDRRTLYVGGLAEEVNSSILQSAFIVFGDIVNIDIPMDTTNGNAHRGFGFVEFEDAEDAQAAIDNMDNGELYGRTLRVNLSNPRIGESNGPNRAVWADADKWFDKELADDDNDIDIALREESLAKT